MPHCQPYLYPSVPAPCPTSALHQLISLVRTASVATNPITDYMAFLCLQTFLREVRWRVLRREPGWRHSEGQLHALRDCTQQALMANQCVFSGHPLLKRSTPTDKSRAFWSTASPPRLNVLNLNLPVSSVLNLASYFWAPHHALYDILKNELRYSLQEGLKLVCSNAWRLCNYMCPSSRSTCLS